MRTRVRAILALGLLAGTVGVLAQDEVIILNPPAKSAAKFDATVRMTGRLVAAGVGYGWGRGVINYDGVDQDFCIHGLSIGDVGIVRMRADGVVFNLHTLGDFSGDYFAISTGVALVGGESAALLKNSHGVTIQLETSLRGLAVSLAGSRLRINMAGTHGCVS